MPVRSANLKLVVPRSPSGAALLQALWTTHAEINAASHYYEAGLLLLCAGGYESLTPMAKRGTCFAYSRALALRSLTIHEHKRTALAY
jgi:hypothetical protein